MSEHNRRTFLMLGAGTLALGALSLGGWELMRRGQGGRRSETITGEWPELEAGVFWLLPNLHNALMVVPDRPHSLEEAKDPALRARIGRVRSFRVSTNSRRLRGPEIQDQPEKGTSRILAIGDSVTFGWGVSVDQAWPARLEAELRARGHKVELLNAGVPAQSLHGMRAYLSREAPRLGLTGVIFTRRPPMGPSSFDEYARAVQDSQRALPGVRFQVVLPPISRFDPHGSEVQQIEEDSLRARLPETPLLDLTRTFREAQGADQGCTLEAQGDNLRVIDLKTGRTLLEAPRAPHDLPREIYGLFEREPAVREPLFFDSGHPDEPGFELFATTLATALEQGGWFG